MMNEPGVQVPYGHKAMNDGRPPQRTCCPSRMDKYHNETCPNAGQNEEWRSMGGIRWGREAFGARLCGWNDCPKPELDSFNAWQDTRMPELLFCGDEHAQREWLRRQSLEEDDRRTEEAHPRGTAPSSVVQEESGGYRDIAEILRAESGRIETTVYSLLAHLGIDPDDVTGEEPYLATYKSMATFYVANLILLRERNEMAHDAWRRTGWGGNLMTLFAKVNRLMHALWWHPNSDARTEKPLDHFADAATYAGFCFDRFRAGDERGSER